MKYQAVKYLALLLCMVHTASAECLIDITISSPADVQAQINCLKKECESKLSSARSDNQEDQDAQITYSDKDILKCVDDIYTEYYEKNSEKRKEKIKYLKNNILNSEDLVELINLIKLEDSKLDDIKELIFNNVNYWNETIIQELNESSLYSSTHFIQYIKSLAFDEFHLSIALATIIDNHNEDLVSEYILEKNELSKAIFQIKPTKELTLLILKQISSKKYTQDYLMYAKDIILSNKDLINILISSFTTYTDEMKRIFLNTFKDDYKNELWKYYIIFNKKVESSNFEKIDLSARASDLLEIIQYFNNNDFSQNIAILDIIQNTNNEIYKSTLITIIDTNESDQSINKSILTYLTNSYQNIDKNILQNFLFHSELDLKDNGNIYYLSQLASSSLSKNEYFQYIKQKFQENGKIDLLIYASYIVDFEDLVEIIQTTEKEGISLLKKINIDLIKNINSWVEYTKICLATKCNDLNDILKIPNQEIYNAIFSHGEIPQIMMAVSLISSANNDVTFSHDQINLFISTIENRIPASKYIIIKVNLQRILSQSKSNLLQLIDNGISPEISLANLGSRINEIRKALLLVKREDIEVTKLTNYISTIESILANAKSVDKGSALTEFYDLIKMQKVAIEKGFIREFEKKSILSSLVKIYNKKFDSKWATEYVLNKISSHNNLVSKIDDENEALYEAILLKYALASANEEEIKSLSFDQIDTLKKVIKYHNELPRKIHLNEEEFDYKEILKEYFISFNSQFSTYKNTQVNIPLYCELGDNCIYEMKYDQNIGPLTSISSSAETINFEGLNLKVYKNRDLNIIGSLNDVLLIDSSVDKEMIPDTRPQAAKGIPPKISTRVRYETVCVLRIKFGFGNKCIKKETFKITDEYVQTQGFPPNDGLEGFKGANSSDVVLNLDKSSHASFARVLIINSPGIGGKGQLGGVWDEKQTIGNGRLASGGRESDVTTIGFGFGFGSPGKGKKVSLNEAIPDYKEFGENGKDGKNGDFGKIVKNRDSSSISIFTIGKSPE